MINNNEVEKKVRRLSFQWVNVNKVKVYRYQPNKNGPPRMILSIPTYTITSNYHDLPYNYEYIYHNKEPYTIIQTKIGSLITSGMFFYFRRVRKANKSKRKSITRVC
jgi:hypothetical protein